jgi:alpha-beta hydrolase superfamily lysophospholipase
MALHPHRITLGAFDWSRRHLLTLARQRAAGLLVLLVALSGCAPRVENIVFRNGDVSLAGTLYFPRSATKAPAILLVHGDGAETRAGYEFFARRFAERGIAALVYDKRGAGESTGRWPAQFADLAADAAAGLNYLRKRADVDGDCVGIWGGSQGGWIAPLAAHSTPVRYLVIKAGTPVGPGELTRWKSARRVERAGYGRDVTTLVDRLMELQFRILRGEDGWDELEQAVRDVTGEPWFPLVAVMRFSNWRSSWMEYGADIDFDPLAVLSRLDAPMLWLLGDRDPETPHELTVARLEELRRRGRQVSVHVFHGADHQIELPRQLATRPNFAPGYPELMVEWVANQCAPTP